MIKYLKIGILLFLFSVTSIYLAEAQDLSFLASAPKVVRAGEQIQLEYSLNQDVDEFTPPDFGEFRYLGGPVTGSSTSIQIINGKPSKSSSYSFTYYIQAPGTGGKYKLNPATAVYKNKQVQSNSLEIEVVGQSGNTASSNSSANTTQNSENPDEFASGDDIFIRLETDKKAAYVGEQIVAWIKIYSKVGISWLDGQFKGPNYIGFYKQDVEIPPLNSLESEKVGNDIYGTGILRKVILYPQKNGSIVIEPFDILVEVQKQSKRRSRSIFDDFFGNSYERARINLQSKPVRLNIKTLPGNQPADFIGAVGKFDIYATVNKTEAKTNDAITFKVKVSGKGNIKLIESLKTNFPADFDAFEPIIKTTVDDGTYGTTGSKSFEYTVIPRHAGHFEIVPFTFSFFDLASGTYKTLSTQSFQLDIAKGEVDSNTVVVSNLSKEDVKMLGVDIRYIESATKLSRKSDYIFGSVGFFMFYILLTIALITLLIVRWERIRKSSDVAKAKNKKAGKVALKRLKSANKALLTGQNEVFYDEIARTLWGYLSDKLNIPVSELTNEKAKEELKVCQVDDLDIEKYFSLTEQCEFARFAPGTKESDKTHMLMDAKALLNKLEESIQR